MGKSVLDVRLVKAHIEIFLISDRPMVKDKWIPVADLVHALKEKNICQNKEDLTQKIVFAALDQIDFVQLNENKTKIRKRIAEKELPISQKSPKVKCSKSKVGGKKAPGKPKLSRGSSEKKKQGEPIRAKKLSIPLIPAKAKRGDSTKRKQKQASKQPKKVYDGGSPTNVRRGKKDLRRTVFAFGLKQGVTEANLMTICTEHGQVKYIYFEGHEDGPQRAVAEIIMAKSARKCSGGKLPGNMMALKTVFIVFASQGQATKLVKARGRNASMEGPLDFRCIHKFDYLRVAKRAGLCLLENVSVSSTPMGSPNIAKSLIANFPNLPAPITLKVQKYGVSPWEQKKPLCKRPRSAPGPRPLDTKIVLNKDVDAGSPAGTKRWRMRSPSIDEGMPMNCQMEPLSLQNLKWRHRSPSFGGRFNFPISGDKEPGLPRKSPASSSTSATSRHSFGNIDVAKGPPDLYTTGFFWMRNPLYHKKSCEREEVVLQQKTKPILQVAKDPPMLAANASGPVNAKIAVNEAAAAELSGAAWDPSFSTPMDPATIMTALDLMPLNFKTPSPTPPAL